VLAAVALYLLCTCVAIVRRKQGRIREALVWALAGWGALGLMYLA
jgi:hypothetical protein